MQKYKIETSFIISGRGLVVLLDRSTELGVGYPHKIEISSPSGERKYTEAYKEWLTVVEPQRHDKEAFLLKDFEKEELPIDSIIQFVD